MVRGMGCWADGDREEGRQDGEGEVRRDLSMGKDQGSLVDCKRESNGDGTVSVAANYVKAVVGSIDTHPFTMRL